MGLFDNPWFLLKHLASDLSNDEIDCPTRWFLSGFCRETWHISYKCSATPKHSATPHRQVARDAHSCLAFPRLCLDGVLDNIGGSQISPDIEQSYILIRYSCACWVLWDYSFLLMRIHWWKKSMKHHISSYLVQLNLYSSVCSCTKPRVWNNSWTKKLLQYIQCTIKQLQFLA